MKPGAPFVSCICPTTGRRKSFLPQAISLWRAQTYPYKELIILCDGDEDVAQSIPNDPYIRYAFRRGYRTIGQKRNLLCAMAAGDIICHWDDDDYSHPERIEKQLEYLGDHPVTGFNEMQFTDGSSIWLYRGLRDYALGTSLMYRKSWWQSHPFPDQQIGEDAAFVRQAAVNGCLVAVPAKHLMVASIHPSNTSRRITHGSRWAKLSG